MRSRLVKQKGRNRPQTAVHGSHLEWLLTDQRAVVGPMLFTWLVSTHYGHHQMIHYQ